MAELSRERGNREKHLDYLEQLLLSKLSALVWFAHVFFFCRRDSQQRHEKKSTLACVSAIENSLPQS